MKIGFLSYFPPHDKSASSGTNFKMFEQLQHIAEVNWIPLKYTLLGRILIKLGYLNNKYLHMGGANISPENKIRI